jgi:CRISPR-associated protein Csd1
MTVVFWAESTDTDYEDCFASVLNTPDDAQDKLESIWTKVKNGEAIDNLQMDTPFYVLGLSPNAARLSVRFFLQSSFGSILENLLKHQERLAISKPVWERKYLSLYWLLRETVNEKSKDKSPTPLLAGAMLRSILIGEPYPAAFYQGILLRVKAEHEVSSGKAAGIKAYLMFGQTIDKKEGLTVALNEAYREKAYILGRLFSVLERAQEEANPGINSTIKDRYFSSACASPGLVFPRLIKLANYHNAKSDNGKWRDKEIGELMDMLSANQKPFPMHLPLAEQGLFMLGYYQQRQDRYTSHKKEEEEQ